MEGPRNMPADFWPDAVGGAIPLLISAGLWRASSLCIQLFQLRASDRMHRRDIDAQVTKQRAQLDMVRTLAEAGVTAVLGPTTAVVFQPDAPPIIEQLL